MAPSLDWQASSRHHSCVDDFISILVLKSDHALYTPCNTLKDLQDFLSLTLRNQWSAQRNLNLLFLASYLHNIEPVVSGGHTHDEMHASTY